MRSTTVRLAAGPKIHCAEYGDPGGDPVVFLHGWPDSWFSFSRVLPRLPEKLRALAFDQRGFGESDRPASGYSISELAADAVALIDALDIERAALVGHSFGSFVARWVAIAYPERVSALALIGRGFSTVTPVLRELQNALRDLPDPIPESFAREFQAARSIAPCLRSSRLMAALPTARLEVYEETGHCPNWEQPEAVARDIAAFVR